jgi:putative ABC transport system permease protein
MAVGADRSDILRLILRQGLWVVMAGVLSGLILAFVLARSMAVILVGVRPTDPLTFAAATLLLTGIGLSACYLPAWRAMNLDPMLALRYE